MQKLRIHGLDPNDGTPGQVPTINTGGTKVEWGDPAGGGAIDDLSDVDTSTDAPTTGEALVWDGTNWVPATISGTITTTAWTALSLASGIVSHADNFGFPPQYRKVGDEVQLRGVVRRSSGSFGTSNTTVGTLPSGFRPTDPGGGAAAPVIYCGAASASAIATRIQIDLAGVVSVATAATSAWASIDARFSIS